MEHDKYTSEGYVIADEDDWISKWELQSMFGIGNPLNNWGAKKKKSNKKQFTVDKAEELYQKTKQAKVGETIQCPTCRCELPRGKTPWLSLIPYGKEKYQQKFHKIKCNTKFEGHWSVPTAAIVRAKNVEEATIKLNAVLVSSGLKGDAKVEDTPEFKRVGDVVILSDGDY
jgi:hypothetical protein